MDLTRDGHAVAAIVSLAAEHRDAVPLERGKARGQELDHAASSILHKHNAWDASLDSAAVHATHLFRGENLHMRLATNIVISSGCSGECVHCLTASMVRAIISSEPACSNFSSRSRNRS